MDTLSIKQYPLPLSNSNTPPPLYQNRDNIVRINLAQVDKPIPTITATF